MQTPPCTPLPIATAERIDGLATFAAAAFLTALGLVAALARVGAPDRVVAALGPLVAVLGLVTLGLVNRTARLGDFLAARRAVRRSTPAWRWRRRRRASRSPSAAKRRHLRAMAGGGRRPRRRGADRRAAAAARQRQRRRRRAGDALPGRADPPRFRAGHLRRRRADGGGRIRRRGRRARRGGRPQPPLRRDRDRHDAGRRRRPRRPQRPAVDDAASAGAALAVAAIGAALAWSGGGGGGVAAEWLAIPAEPNDAAFLLRSAAARWRWRASAVRLAVARRAEGEAQHAGGRRPRPGADRRRARRGRLGRFADSGGGAIADRDRAGRRSGVAAGGGAGARRRRDGGARLRRRPVGRLCALRRARQPAIARRA